MAQSIHYHSVGMVIALELHVHVYMNISFEVSIRWVTPINLGNQNFKLKSLIMAQIERWRQA